MKDTLLPAFLPGKANIVVTCAPIMEEGLKKGFEESGFKTQVRPLAHFQEDYGFKADSDEEDEEDEEDEDEEMLDGSGDETDESED